MSKLYQAFNVSFLQGFRNIYKSFRGMQGLHTELERFIKLVRANAETPEIFREFDRDTRAHVDALFRCDTEALDRVPLFVRMDLPLIFTRLRAEEHEAFWATISTLLKYESMLNACGSQVGVMESMAMDFVRSNPNMNPNEYHQAVVQEMLNGGEMSQRLMETFKQPGVLENILGNFGNLLRRPGEEPIDLSGIAKMVKPEELANIDEEFKKMQDQIRESGQNPFAEIQGMLKPPAGGTPAADGSAPDLDSFSAAPGLSDAVRKLAQRIAEEKAKQQ